MSFTLLRAYDNYVYANMQLSMLQEQDINCHLKDEFTVTIDPLLNPAIGGIKLMVADVQVERAEKILNDAELEWLKTIPCPSCGQKRLRKEVRVKEFPGFWGKMKSMLANGQETEVKKVYICDSCRKEFKEIESPED
jgi:DNA-directed RNA polymerase subunit RPC12/RpoP